MSCSECEVSITRAVRVCVGGAARQSSGRGGAKCGRMPRARRSGPATEKWPIGGPQLGPATARATQRRGRRGRPLPSRWHCQLQCARASPRVPRGLQAIERRAAAAANHAAIERPSIALPRALFTLSASITLKGSAPDGDRTLCLLHSRATLSIHTREWPRPRLSICIPPS